MALALLRLGRDAEATALLEAVTAEAPTDDAVLQAMTIAFREMQQRELVLWCLPRTWAWFL